MAVAQLKGLDRHREKELYEAEKVLKKFNCVNRSKNMDGVRRKEHYYGKAYSYYGQAIRIDCIQFANIDWIYPIDYLVFMKLIIVKLTNSACKFTNNQK